MSALCSLRASRYLSTSQLTPRFDDLEAGALHHHRHEVLADVVDVALDGADHHLADSGRPGLGQQRAQDRHAALHGVGGKQHLGHEQDAVAEVDADDRHAADQRLGQDGIGLPAALQEDVDALLDLWLEPVVEVILDLLDELVVVQLAKIEIAARLAHHHLRPAATHHPDPALARRHCHTCDCATDRRCNATGGPVVSLPCCGPVGDTGLVCGTVAAFGHAALLRASWLWP